MQKWQERLKYPFAAAGLVCLVVTVILCLMLNQGGRLDRVGMALAMLVLAAALMFLLWKEGVGRNTLLLMLLPVGVAMLVRVLCLDYVGLDYSNFLSAWYDFFRENGGFKAMAWSVGDYNVPYLYFMALISYLPIPPLYMIKLFSLVFDVVLAWGGLRLTRVLRGGRERDPVPLVAFSLLLLLPTVVLNGAYWGQCDAIYGALTLHALALVLEGKNKSSVALLALAFAFKLQTVFLIPLWGVLWLARKVKFRQLLVFPAAYAVIILPAVLMGKPLKDIIGIYFTQMSEYSRLTLNAPSIFQLFPYDMTIVETAGSPLLETLSTLGTAAAAVLVLVLLALGLYFRDRLDHQAVVAFGMVLVLGVPFLLPHMHERYFFLADILSLCWACVNRRRIPVAVLVSASSVASYRVFLRLQFNFPFWVAGHRFVMIPEMLAMLAALVISIVVLVGELRRLRRCAGPVGGEYDRFRTL